MRSFQRNIPTLQRSFRKKQSQKKENEELKKSVRWQETETKRRKQRSFRQTREKQLQSIEIVPASKTVVFSSTRPCGKSTEMQQVVQLLSGFCFVAGHKWALKSGKSEV